MMTMAAAPILYRLKDIYFRIYTIEEGKHGVWTKFHEDYAELKNMKRSTKQEFEILRIHMGYEEDVNTASTLINCKVS
ncbi:MAG TPA: hypothetical protein VIP70_07775 [Nitrososphaeraceae archaeon]